MVDRVKALIDGGIVLLLIDHLAGRIDTSEKIIEYSVITLCNLCSSKDVRTSMIELGGIELFTKMISSNNNRKILVNCKGSF